MSTQRRWLVSVLAAVALVLVGCGSDEPERADTVEGSPSAAGSSASSAPPDLGSAAGDVLTEAQAQAALLTVEDLPTGWSIDSSQDEDDGPGTIEPAECDALFPENAEAEPVAEVEANYTAGGFGPILTHEVSSFEEGAAGRLDEFSDALNQCTQFSSTDAEGVTTEFTASALSFPNLGDQTLAVRLQASTPDIEAVFDVVLIAVGNNGVGIQAGGLVPMQGTELESLAVRAIDKLETASQSP